MRGRAIPYSDAEMAWLEKNRVMVVSDYTRAFNARFKRDLAPDDLHRLRKRKRWLIGRAACSAKAKGSSRVFTADQIAWLKANVRLPLDAWLEGFNEKFGREITPAQLISLRKRKGWRTGRTGRFEKGITPHNKGKPCPPGKGGRHPNARRTQFKKGSRSGRAVALYQPIGAERLSKEGYRERKIHDGLPMQSRWRGLHLIRWEEKNGPIPAGHCLKCLDGDKANAALSNWELIPRALLPLLNGRHGIAYDDAPPELKPTVLAMARVKSAVRAKQRGRTMKLSEHFTLAEFTASDTARRFGLDNTPPAAIQRVLRETAAGMETVRAILCEEAGRDIPIIITSCYRSPAVNKKVGSGPKSSHIGGRACDFKAPAFGSPLKVAKALEKARAAGRLDYDQLIHEFGAWVHIGFDPRMRGQALTIYSEGGKARTVDGLRAVK